METLASFHCENEKCRLPILLPADVLRQPFLNPDESPNDTFAIGLACPYCKHLHRYFLHPQLDRNPLGQAFVAEIPDKEAVLVDTLSCEESGCEFQLPIFAQWSIATSAGWRKADTRTWHWENLLCPEGHEVRKPSEW